MPGSYTTRAHYRGHRFGWVTLGPVVLHWAFGRWGRRGIWLT